MRLLAHDPAILSRYTVLRLAAALGLVISFVPVHAAAAQDPYPDLDDIGLVMNIHTQEVAPALSSEALEATSATIRPVATTMVWLIDRLGGADVLESIKDDKDDMLDDLSPHTSAMDYTIYVKNERMRVDMGNSSLLARLDPTGSVLEFGVLDPKSGQLVRSDLYDEAVRLGSTDPYDPDGGTGENVWLVHDEDPAPTGETKEILGYVAHQYKYVYNLSIDTEVDYEDWNVMIHVRTEGEMWIAEEGSYIGNPDVASVFRVFVLQSYPSAVAQLADRGLLLAGSEKSWIAPGIDQDYDTTLAFKALEAFSSFEVTSIGLQPVDDALLAGFEQERQACDCSCAAFERVKEISDDDNVMGTAACMQKCMPKWMRCINEIPVGGGCSVRPGHSI